MGVVTAPLRSAVLHCAARRLPFTEASLALLGYSSEAQAKAYVTCLCKNQVLERSPEGRLKAGPRYDAWATSCPRTKPGGHRVRRYRNVG